MPAKPLILFFKDIDKNDTALVGGKGANLGEMAAAGFPVPPGFAITVESYDLFLVHNNLVSEVRNILSTKDLNDPQQLTEASRLIRKKIKYGEIPEEIAKVIIKAYGKLSGFMKHALVAVRSSATAEDMPGTSFAGQQITYLNIKGEANLLVSVRECWASLFTPRSIFYRETNKIPHEKVKISVIVQKMIQSKVSGVIFTIDPVTQEKDKIIIEAVWGLGEMIVQGSVVPDRYIVQKETFSILSKEVSDQSVQLIKKGSENKEVEVPQKIRDDQKISDDMIIKLAKIADKLQKHYYFPQDIEWAKDENDLFIVQTRPVTGLNKIPSQKIVEGKSNEIKIAQLPILTGQPASPGIGVGEAVVIKSAKEINKVKSGDVLVAPMTSPDFVPAMRKASAIITDQGGATSHAAIVSRELGIPCVVGTKEATIRLKSGTVVTVNGMTGEIFLGSKIKVNKEDEKPEKIVSTKSATKLYVNLAEPERAEEIAQMNVDGVGLLRAEFMIANIGIHPKEAIKEKKQDSFVEKLSSDIAKFCKAFQPRPVVYRATDFKTNEYRSLPGGKSWEPLEPNPLLGFRGAIRYITNPEVFNLELQAIKEVRKKYNNLRLMIPFVRSPEELAKVRRLVATEGLFSESSFKLWMMVELPVNVIMLEDFIKVGIDGVSIGSNDLTMLLLGTDRDNSEVARSFDERSPAVMWAIKKVVKTCNNYGITSSVCGQAPSTYDDFVEDLIKMGVTSISINPDAVNRVRQVIINSERQLISGKIIS
jgi:pyruvate,water dikinase